VTGVRKEKKTTSQTGYQLQGAARDQHDRKRSVWSGTRFVRVLLVKIAGPSPLVGKKESKGGRLQGVQHVKSRTQRGEIGADLTFKVVTLGANFRVESSSSKGTAFHWP